MTRLANGDWSYEAAVRRLLQDDGRHPAPHWCRTILQSEQDELDLAKNRMEVAETVLQERSIV